MRERRGRTSSTQLCELTYRWGGGGRGREGEVANKSRYYEMVSSRIQQNWYHDVGVRQTVPKLRRQLARRHD